MSKTGKKVIILSIIGLVIGILVSTGFGWEIVTAVAAGNEKAVTLIGFLLLGGINGAICMGTTVFYEMDSWSILRCTATHFVVAMSSLYITGYLQGWVRFGEAYTGYMMISTVIAYFIIWLIMFCISKKQVKELNRNLEILRSEEKEEKTEE